MPDIFKTINKELPGLLSLGSTRNLPNGGGSYNLKDQATLTPTVQDGNTFDKPTMDAAVELFKRPAMPTPSVLPQQETQDISPEDLAGAFNERIYGVSRANVPTAEQVSSMSPYQQYTNIREQMLSERLNGTGAYAIPSGMAYSPDQVRQIYNEADNAYNKKLSEIQSVIQNQAGKKFGLDSIFSGMSPTTVNLISGEENNFRQEKGVKDFNIIQNSAIQSKQIIDRLKKTGATGNGADDQRLIYLFAKAQDPDSVVREGEYANASRFLSTIPQGIVSQITRVANIDKNTGKLTIATTPDGFLTPDAREQIVKALDEQYSGSKQTYDNLRREYVRRINSYSGQQGLGEQMLINYSGAYESPNGSTQVKSVFAEEW